MGSMGVTSSMHVLSVSICTLLILSLLLPFASPAPTNCQCFNPYLLLAQSQDGDPKLTCSKKNLCYVPCTSGCSDMRMARGGMRCLSAKACDLPGGSEQKQKYNQECTSSVCQQTNHITIVTNNVQNCLTSDCNQVVG